MAVICFTVAMAYLWTKLAAAPFERFEKLFIEKNNRFISENHIQWTHASGPLHFVFLTEYVAGYRLGTLPLGTFRTP